MLFQYPVKFTPQVIAYVLNKIRSAGYEGILAPSRVMELSALGQRYRDMTTEEKDGRVKTEHLVALGYRVAIK